ncbi:MAG: sugar porter family MFS transporter [Gammaproteobacteria bacterium]
MATPADAATGFTTRVALSVALGGFLMGFDASVISGVVGFIEDEFGLSKLQLGWAVASLTLAAAGAMMLAGPLSDRFGRRPVLRLAAVLFMVSAVASALAPGFASLVIARMVGGLGVGAALIIAPMYIAEIAPPRKRGRLVSLNQLNIVVGISAAFFSNYLILRLGRSDLPLAEALGLGTLGWRWMLGVEALPAVVYLLALAGVPESPRWLAMTGRPEEARRVLTMTVGTREAEAELAGVARSLAEAAAAERPRPVELLRPAMRRVMVVGLSIAVLQQATGINAVFFYAPVIFEQSGIGTDAAFIQAILVGLVNLVFTLLALALIDRLGRRPLLGFGLAGVAACMFLLAYGFGSASYVLDSEAVAELPAQLDRAELGPLMDVQFGSDTDFRAAVSAAVGSEAFLEHEAGLLAAAIRIDPLLILVGILGFVASFAVSLGPVMWVLFSELFPNRLRGLAVSCVGLVNSAVSFLVQLVFPWELATLGNSVTFLVYGLIAAAGLAWVLAAFPETRGRSLEELEQTLVRS